MSWLSKFKNAIHPERLDQDLSDEMADHLARRVAELIEQGLTPIEAKRRASTIFGNATTFREQSREARLWSLVETTLQDIRYAWRGLLKSPAFAVTAVLSLSLAIGTNTAIYSVLNAALLRPLPVPEPHRLFTLTAPAVEQPGTEAATERDDFSYPLYARLRTAAGNSARMFLFGYADRAEVQGPETNAPIEKAVQQYISGGAFGILDVHAALGRVFSAGDDLVPGAAPYVVLSKDYWRRRFGGDRDIIGRQLLLSGRPYRIIGVAAPGFFGVEPGRFVDMWVPIMQFDPGVFTNPNASIFRLMGRLAPGISPAQLQARLQPAFRRQHEDLIQVNPSISPSIQRQMLAMSVRVNPGATGASRFRTTFGRPLWIVWGVSAGILLIACANVASLMLARSTSRVAEMALRISLGAARLRLVRQLLTESLVLSLLAGGFGWLLALWAAPALIHLLSRQGDPLQFGLTMDLRALLFCLGVSGAAAAFFGLLPAWQAAGTRAIGGLYGVQGQSGQLKLGRFFVSVQVAFAFCLVVGGAGFLFSLRNLVTVDTGFDARGVTILSVANSVGPGKGVPNRDAMISMQQFQNRIAALPGVQSASAAWWAIFEGSKRLDQVIVPDKPPSDGPEIFYRVSSGYFATLKTPLLSGRDLDFRDNDGTEPVPTVVNLAFSRKYFNGADPLGKEFRRDDGVRHQIVGVAANAYYGDLRGGPKPVAYFPMKPARRFTLYVRSAIDPGSIARIVEREGQAMGLRTRVTDVTTLETLVGNSILREKMLAGIAGVFGFLGLVLAAIGLFGLLSYSVARRTKEIGVRAALGARRHELLLLVFRELFGMMGIGLAAGLIGSLALMTVVRSLLFGIRPADPAVMATAAGIFVFAALIAGGLPARRAAAIDPLTALRHE